MDKKNKKVIVAISGGVDSSVMALLLKEQGYDVTGVYMRLGENKSESEDAARRVCQILGIKFFPVNLSSKFKKDIINYFVQSYAEGITPNPCVRCNKLIKFGEMIRVMCDLSADYLATGHYIRLRRKFSIFNFQFSMKLFKGLDSNKDQSYFLYNLTQGQLKHILFPLGNYSKKEIKKIAKENDLPNLKKESQDVCFLNIDGKIFEHNDYLKKYIKEVKGDIKTLDGEVVGEHKGLPFYTIGQRRGVEIGGTGPYYVVKQDYKTNTLYVTNNSDDKALYSKILIASNVNWISGEELINTLKCDAVIRYRHKGVVCSVKKEGEIYKVEFNEPQRAVTVGQSVVFYKKDELLGGGIVNDCY